MTILRNYKTIILVANLALIVGCSSVKVSSWLRLPLDSSKPNESSNPKNAVGIPKLEVAGQNLGESQEISLTTEEFQRSVSDLLDAQREVTASRWIARHPEATLEFLRKSGEQSIPPATLAFIARVHDRQTVRPESGASWENLILLRSQPDGPLAKYDRARAHFLNRLSQGQVDKAFELKLDKFAEQVNQALVSIDAAQLQGTALLLADRPADAVVEFQRGLKVAEPVSSYQSAYLQLILSDAQRRAGDSKAAVMTWLAAANTAANLLDRERPCTDPVLWERLAYLRPVSVPWPDAVANRWRQIDPIPSSSDMASSPSAEALLWNCIGRWYLDRRHHQAALVAFKRAEASESDSMAKQFLRFRQARALILLGQMGPATAILVSLGKETSSPLARPSLALLGSMRVQSGEVQQGLQLLRNAVEGNNVGDWNERTDAEADYGLALLLIGDEQQGMKWLHRAQQRFEQRNEFESLTLSLFNEANYLAETKRQANSDALRQRLKNMEKLH